MDIGAVGGIPEEPVFTKQPSVDMHSTQDFPTLGNTAPIIPQVSQAKNRGNLIIRGRKPGQITDEDFPALGPSLEPSGSGPSKSVNLSVTSGPGTSGLSRVSQSSNLSIQVNHKANGTVTTRVSGPNIRIRPAKPAEDFPALRSASGSQPVRMVECRKLF